MSRVAVSTILLVAMFSFSAFAVAEIVGASIAHSESLMADAATMIVDGVTYAINYWAEYSKKGKTPREQLKRDVAAPLVSTFALIAVTVFVLVDSVKTLKGLKDGGGDDVEINVRIMWIFASINLVLDFINIALFLLKKDDDGQWRIQCCGCGKGGGDDQDDSNEDNLNMMSALAHVAADTLRSVAVMIAGLYAQLSPADDSAKADAVAAIVVSVAIAGSIFPLMSSVFWKVLELWGGDDYSRVGSGSPTAQLLDYDDVFASSEDDEEIVPYKEVNLTLLSPPVSTYSVVNPLFNNK